MQIFSDMAINAGVYFMHHNGVKEKIDGDNPQNNHDVMGKLLNFIALIKQYPHKKGVHRQFDNKKTLIVLGCHAEMA